MRRSQRSSQGLFSHQCLRKAMAADPVRTGLAGSAGIAEQLVVYEFAKTKNQAKTRSGSDIILFLLAEFSPNLGLQPTPASLRSGLAPAAGGADAARRQAEGAASLFALPRRHQRRISRRVAPHADHRLLYEAFYFLVHFPLSQ
jgi:hypothetical protein